SNKVKVCRSILCLSACVAGFGPKAVLLLSLAIPKPMQWNGHTLFGQGDLYWDGLGGNGGVTKSAPFIRVNNTGSFSNVHILNAPERSIAVKGLPVTVSGITINNSLSDLPISRSNGLPAGPKRWSTSAAYALAPSPFRWRHGWGVR
ncbi:hypothetical protein B0H13DRAFT_2519690, partial [Mycena leptocephala]